MSPALAHRRHTKLGRLGKVFLIIFLGIFGLLGLVVVSLNLPFARNIIRQEINRALSQTFAGQLVIDRIGSLRLDVIAGVDAHVMDPSGRRVINVKGLQAQSNWPELVLALLRGRPPTLRLAPLSVDHIELNLIDDRAGAPTLTSAFKSRHPTPPTNSKSEFSVVINGFSLKHVWAHGALNSVPIIDTEVFELAGTFQLTPQRLSVAISRAQLQSRSLPGQIDPKGTLLASAHVPLDESKQYHFVADYRGLLAMTPATLHAELNATVLNAALEAKDISPSVIAAWLPNARLRRSSSLSARVHGQLPNLELETAFDSEAGAVNITGQARLGKDVSASLAISAVDVNLGPVLDNASTTRLNATALARFETRADGGLRAVVETHLRQGKYNEFVTPRVDADGTFYKHPDGALEIAGNLAVLEPGAPVFARYSLQTPPAGEPTIRTSFEIPINGPPQLRRLAGFVANGKIVGDARYLLLSRTISAHAHAVFEPLSLSQLRTRKLDLTLTASGHVNSPALRLVAEARDIRTAYRRFTEARIEAAGYVNDGHVEGIFTSADDNATIRLSTDVHSQPTVALDGPQIRLRDTRGEIVIRADQIAVQNGTLQIERLASSGAGEVQATGSFGHRRIRAKVSMDRLDLGRFSRWAGLRFTKSGNLSLTADLEGPIDSPRGYVRGSASRLSFGDSTSGEVVFAIEAKDRKVSGSVESRVGHSNLHAVLDSLTLPKTVSVGSLLHDVRGTLEVQGVVSLSELQKPLAEVGVPVEVAAGVANVALRYQHQPDTPRDSHVHLALKTQHLRIVEQRPQNTDPKSPRQAREAAPRAIEGIDVDMDCDIEPFANFARLHAQLTDAKGPMLVLDAQSAVPALSSNGLTRELTELPFKLIARVPERNLDKLPRSLRPTSIHGVLAFDLEADGTPLNPRATAHVSLRHLQSREGRNYIDVQADSQYASTGGSLDAQAHGTRGGYGEFHSDWKGNLIERLRYIAADTQTPFELNSSALLHDFPVGVVPQLSDRQIRGTVNGSLRMTGLGRDASLSANLDASRLSVNRVQLNGLKGELNMNGREVAARLDVTQSLGSAHAEFTTPSTWGPRLVPQLGPTARVTAHAKEFQLAMVSPFVLQYVSTLEGRLNADVSADLGQAKPRVSGTLSVADGVIQVPVIGQRFSDVTLRAAIHDGAIDVSSVSARGTTGRVTAKAKAEIAGTQLAAALAEVDIRQNEKLPVTFEGANIGDAWGHISVSYSSAQHGAPTDIHVDVPQLNLQMPETAQASVQELDPATNIRIGAHRADGRFVEIPLQPLEPETTDGEPPKLTRIFVHLGNAVWVERDRQAKVQLAGDIEIDSGEKQRFSGRIELRGGRLDVSGKEFEIERGAVTFDGPDPSNPIVTATARWDSPASYTVYAEYVGTVKQGHLKVYSDPSLSQDEILSLILFGSPDGSIASSSSSNGAIGNIVNGSPNGTAGNPNNNGPTGSSAAMSVAGGTATQGLNRAIADVTNLDVSTRIDTSTGSARPELVVQLTPRLTTRVTRALGEPAPGESPDRTFVTLELRLKRSWSLSAIVGDHGASTLDLIWRKRY